MAETRQIHTDYRVLWRKRDSTATLSRGKRPNPCLDRLLLLFWVQYMEDDPHVANYIKEEGYLQMQREKWLSWLHWSLESLA